MTEDFVAGCRRATPEDVDRIGALASRACKELADFRGGVELHAESGVWAESTPRFAEHLSDENWLVAIGQVQGMTVGYLVASIDSSGSAMTLDQIYVEPDGRCVGVGTAMLRFALDAARRLDLSRLESRALPGMRNTKNFFERHGLVTRLLVVSSKVDHRSPQRAR